MVCTSYPKFGGRNWLRWVARFCLLAPAATAIILSYHPVLFFYFGRGPSRGLEQALAFGVPLLVIAGIAWIWSGPGGMTAILWAIPVLAIAYTHKYFDEVMCLRIFGTFFVGGILHLVTARYERITLPDKWLRWSASVVTLAPPAIYIFAIGTVWTPLFYIPIPVFAIGVCVLALGLAILAWVRPALGGILVVLFGGWFFYAVLFGNYYGQIFLPLLGIYTTGGILHLIRAWPRQKAELED